MRLNTVDTNAARKAANRRTQGQRQTITEALKTTSCVRSGHELGLQSVCWCSIDQCKNIKTKL